MFGCVDAEQGQATGQHRPGGFGEREPGTVGGRGFLRPARQHRGQQGQHGIGDADEVPGKSIGSAVRGGLGEHAGVVGQGVEEGLGVAAWGFLGVGAPVGWAGAPAG